MAATALDLLAALIVVDTQKGLVDYSFIQPPG